MYLEKRLIIVYLMGFASGLPFLLSGATLPIRLAEAGLSLTMVGDADIYHPKIRKYNTISLKEAINESIDRR